MQSLALKVLIVDDEVPIREELKLFDWDAYSATLVGEAENGHDALIFCRQNIPDVVITDITMPKMDGIQLSNQLRQEFPLIQIIILTAYSDFSYAKEALKLGALDYLIKALWEDEQLGGLLDRARAEIKKETIWMNHYLQELPSKDPELKYRYEIRAAIDIIEKSYCEQITLSSVAHIVGLSPNYLSRLFREEFGKSFNEYIMELRIEKAIQLLETSNLKVYEVAEAIGIPSYRYFSVLFRKRTGLTPKEYRKR